jgi:hypothetical protein
MQNRYYNITNHAKNRFIERFSEGVRINVYKVMNTLLDSAEDITAKLYREYPRFILEVKKKHLNDKPKFFMKDNVMFVCNIEDNKYKVITCYNTTLEMLKKHKNTSLSNESIYAKLNTIFK